MATQSRPVASGTCNYGQELQEITDHSQLGGIVTSDHYADPALAIARRIVETPAGMLNSLAYRSRSGRFSRNQMAFSGVFEYADCG